jgi:pimeloyl-ACP methyl ester carboxylesterase
MPSVIRTTRAVVSAALMVLSIALIRPGDALAQAPQDKFADVNGVKLHYLIAGKGDPVVLLHGFAETSHMWLPLMAKLSDKHTVIAPDLRGFGQSSTPPDGYTKAAMAQDIHALMKVLKYDHIQLVGHDIGLMVAYAYAAQYPGEVDRLVLMEAFLPGVGDWNSVFLLRDLWHFHFYGKTPLALVTGRERIYLEHFWNDFAADPAKSVSETDRRFYANAYAQPGHMKAGMEVFRAFPKDAEDFAGFAKTRLPMPLLVLSGEKAGGPFLIEQGKMVATNVEGVLVKGRGHWLMEEAPGEVIPKLVEFLNH